MGRWYPLQEASLRTLPTRADLDRAICSALRMRSKNVRFFRTSNLVRLRHRALALKRAQAKREFVLGHEAPHRFVDRESLLRALDHFDQDSGAG